MKLRVLGMSVATIAALAASPVFAQEGEKLFLDKCANCHSADGSGQTVKGKKLKLRDLRSAEVQKMTDAQMVDLILKGKGDMAPYSKELVDKQVKALVLYVRSLAKASK